MACHQDKRSLFMAIAPSQLQSSLNALILSSNEQLEAKGEVLTEVRGFQTKIEGLITQAMNLIKTSQTESEELRKQLQQKEITAQTKESALQGEFESLRKRMRSLEDENTQHRATRQRLEQSLASAQSQNQQNTNLIASLQSQLGSANHYIDQQRREEDAYRHSTRGCYN